MSLFTTTSLIVAWCTLEVVNSQSMLVPQPPTGNQYGFSPQDASSYPANAGYQINNTFPGSQDGEVYSNHKEGKNPYKMFYIEKDQFRCEECDEKGKVSGNMTYVDGKLNTIRTVKYETTEIPLDPNTQESGMSSAQPSLSGAQDPYQQTQLIQGQPLQLLQGQQLGQGQQLQPIFQGQQLVQGQQLQPIIQGQQLPMMVQPQQVYQGQPIQAQQGQNYQGNQAVFGPLNNNYPLNPAAPQLSVPLAAPNLPSQNSPSAAQALSNFANNPYTSTASTSFPFALEKPLPEAVSPGVFGLRSIENRASLSTNQGVSGLTNAGGYPSSTMEALAAEAIRNLQPQPIQNPLPAIQPSIPIQPQQPFQPQVLNDNSFETLARRFNFMNSNGVYDKPQGPSTHSSPAHQQPLFSPTSTGVIFNRELSGAYNFQYRTPDTNRKEVADEKNNVMGSYAYRDPNGGIHNVRYDSGPQGFNARELSIAGNSAPAVMPAMILVPTQQPGSVLGQQGPFTLVAAGNSPTMVGSNSDSAGDKTIPKDEDAAKPSDTETTESMLQKLAKQIVKKMEEGPLDGNVIPQSTAEGEQPTEAR